MLRHRDIRGQKALRVRLAVFDSPVCDRSGDLRAPREDFSQQWSHVRTELRASHGAPERRPGLRLPRRLYARSPRSQTFAIADILPG